MRVNMTANIHIDLTYVCVYFGVYSHGVHMCLGIYLLCTRRVYMYIFTYMRTEFTCVGIYLRICTQGLYVYVYILRIYTQSSHVRVNMIANIHIKPTYVCV